MVLDSLFFMFPVEYLSELKDVIKGKKPDKESLSKIKVVLNKKYGLKQIPTDIQLLMSYSVNDLKELKKYLVSKPVRTGSGVAVLAIMTAPFVCPHGRCKMCPGGPGSIFGDVPMSYTGNEPASMRAARNKFDPYYQIFNRLEQYILLGQNPEKGEVIIMGGTFPSLPKEYKDDFVYNIYKACNDFSDMFYSDGELLLEKFKEFFEMPGPMGKARQDRIHEKLLQFKAENKKTLDAEQVKNETSMIKVVGLTIETRPDHGYLEHANEMLDFGCTRVELGIQSVYQHSLDFIYRCHSEADNRRSIRELKDVGFKINMHYMPGIPDTSREDDIAGMKQLFSNEEYRPDMLKIYPLMIMPGTPFYKEYKDGKITPINTSKALDRIAEFMGFVPRYCRVMRVQRDIPTKVTTAGVDVTNLRQYLDSKMKEKGIVSQDIRAREAKKILGEPRIEVIEYDASFGKEFFISMECDSGILGFARLRFPSKQLRKEFTEKTAMIRELHVYGVAIGIGGDGRVQHKGFGRKLMEQAESICKQNGYDKLLVISGVGVRGYYRKLGYEREGPYMSKKL